MHRRQFMASAAALTCIPSLSQAYSAEMFSPTLWRELRGQPKVVVLNFRATWSLTCQIKADILAKLIADKAAYEQIQFVEVDWDTFGPSVLTGRLGVKRHSTLLLMKAGNEVARLENEPFERKIRALLDQALTT